jgi:hypothetical protein
LLVRVLAGRAAEFGGEDDVVPAALQCLADDVLGVAVASAVSLPMVVANIKVPRA